MELSEGMVETAKDGIKKSSFKYEIIDIQDVPYEGDSFDVVIARSLISLK